MAKIKLILGLANPSEKYVSTRHNAGEWFLNLCIPLTAWKNESSLHARIAKKDILWAIPTTYMNLSGQAAQALCHYYKIKAEEVLVVHDDIDLPVARLRLKQGGGHGGHNGLRDIIQKLNSTDFWRLRIGVGRPVQARDVEHYVLAAPSKAEQHDIDLGLERAKMILPFLLEGEFEKAMHRLHSD